MTNRALRTVTINMRTTVQEKSFLQNAAEIAGFSNLTNFVMTTVRREAQLLLKDKQSTYLEPEDWQLVNDLLANPPAPNQKLINLMNKKNQE